MVRTIGWSQEGCLEEASSGGTFRAIAGGSKAEEAGDLRLELGVSLGPILREGLLHARDLEDSA